MSRRSKLSLVILALILVAFPVLAQTVTETTSESDEGAPAPPRRPSSAPT